MCKYVLHLPLVLLSFSKISLSLGKRGPCAAKEARHEQDVWDTMFESDLITEQDILGLDGGRRTEDGPDPEDDILPSATNVHYLDLRWANATVPFVFHNMMSYRGRVQVLRAMNEYHRHTCVQFRKRRAETDYLVIGSAYPVICASSVGRQGGAQLLHLGPACTRSLGTPLHELMHALGFFHEHMRPDRERFVHINYSNIDEPLWKNFRVVHPGREMRELGAGYDFNSLMHYRLCAMTNNSWPTIVPKVHLETTLVGQRRGFSKSDIIKINTFYNCNSVSRTPKLFAVEVPKTKSPELKDIDSSTTSLPNSAESTKSAFLWMISLNVLLPFLKYSHSMKDTKYCMLKVQTKYNIF